MPFYRFDPLPSIIVGRKGDRTIGLKEALEQCRVSALWYRRYLEVAIGNSFSATELIFTKGLSGFESDTEKNSARRGNIFPFVTKRISSVARKRTSSFVLFLFFFFRFPFYPNFEHWNLFSLVFACFSLPAPSLLRAFNTLWLGFYLYQIFYCVLYFAAWALITYKW